METFYHYLTLILIAIYWIMVAVATIRIVLKRRAISVSLAWLMIIYIFPLLGLIMYLSFGELNLGKKRAERAKQMLPTFAQWFTQLQESPYRISEHFGSNIHRIDKLCRHRLGVPALVSHSLSLLASPYTILNEVLKDINQAKHSIKMVFYIWYPGGLVDKVANALILAAHRGVTINLLIDAAGSAKFFRSQMYKDFLKADIKVIKALEVKPLRIFLRRIDLRQHRKIIIIDEHIAYTGSMNMVDPNYFKQNAGLGQWVDVMVRTTGPTVNVLSGIYSWDWELETGDREMPPVPNHLTEEFQIQPVQVVPSGPGMPVYLISQVLNLAINQAEHSIRITTPYFVPSTDLLETIKLTAQRGITVDLIIPHKNDSLMVKWASRAFYQELLECGVRIHEFYGGLLHTKSVVIDDVFCLVGTVNLDMRSLWLNFELTLAIDDIVFTKQLAQLQQSYIDHSYLIELETWKTRSLYSRFLERLFYLFNPLL